MRKNLFISVLFACFVSCAVTQPRKVVYDIKQLAVTWEVIENNYQGRAQSLTALTFANNGKQQFPATGWKIYFNFARYITPKVVNGNVQIDHVNGDLFCMRPVPSFQPVASKENFRVEFVSADWVVNYTDAPNGLYIVWNDAPTGESIDNITVLPSVAPKQYMRFPGDKAGLVTPADLFRQNEQVSLLPEATLVKIFPTPASYTENVQDFLLSAATKINSDAQFNAEAKYLQERITSIVASAASGTAGVIELRHKPMPAGAYALQVTQNKVLVEAGSGEGIFYGIQSLMSLIPPVAFSGKPTTVSIPGVEVNDAPRFGYRAFMLDIARNFQEKQQLLKLLDLMAQYKLNVLHLHFSDDEGWRIQMPSLPELTEVGAIRGHTTGNREYLQPSLGSGPDAGSNFGTGYYSTEDFTEILRYATARHISIIPEIETPGHGRAAIKSMWARYDRLKRAGDTTAAQHYLLQHPGDTSRYRSVQLWNDNVMDVALPSTYAFIERVVDDLIAMYATAGAPLTTIHMGGDEVPSGVWEHSPAYLQLQQTNAAIQNTGDLWYYYYGKVNSILKRKGLFVSGWEEAGIRFTQLDGERAMLPNPDFVNEHFQLHVWNNVLGWGAEDLAYKLANAGYKVVLSCVSNNYFDMAYYKAFDEPGYYWGSYVDLDKPFYFIPYDYFKNVREDRMGNPLDKSLFNGKQRLTEYGKQNIVGIQGLLWSETIKGPERMEYMLLPKLLGLAERAWAKDPDWATEKDTARANLLYRDAWNRFVNVVGQRERPRLDYLSGGYNYRIPTPGAVVRDGAVHVNMQLPGFTIKYTINGDEPTADTKTIYRQPVTDKGMIRIKAFDGRGRGSKTVMIENQ